jgi:hypothetical protein
MDRQEFLKKIIIQYKKENPKTHSSFYNKYNIPKSTFYEACRLYDVLPPSNRERENGKFIPRNYLDYFKNFSVKSSAKANKECERSTAKAVSGQSFKVLKITNQNDKEQFVCNSHEIGDINNFMTNIQNKNDIIKRIKKI